LGVETGLVHAGRITEKEMRQVREKIRGERLPLFVIKDTEQNRRALEAKPLPGTLVRISAQGDIFYPVWRERTRLLRPELYVPCSKLPRGWSFERLLASKRRPISEVSWHQVRKEGGTVEVAIRNMNNILERYQEEGREQRQIEETRGQIDQAMEVLARTIGVSREEFYEGFSNLYRQTLVLMEASGMKRATLALKKDIGRLMEEASTGRDRLGRRNAMVMLKKLQSAARRVEFRSAEIGFIVDKFTAMRQGLESQREEEKDLLILTKHELEIFLLHEAIKFPGKKTSKSQEGILKGKIGTLIYRLGFSLVKPYKTIALEAIEKLKLVQEKLAERDYQAVQLAIEEVLGEITLVLSPPPRASS